MNIQEVNNFIFENETADRIAKEFGDVPRVQEELRALEIRRSFWKEWTETRSESEVKQLAPYMVRAVEAVYNKLSTLAQGLKTLETLVEGEF